jgi:alkanesulfonate monooxygenase SsuD/methylene tetrahydromethanopterin reductase-like flavin-dependent oxidoreductase (luciferase family)
VWMGPTVTCPTLRYRPEVVAQTFASLSNAFSGQIFLGLGSGEALNEQAARDNGRPGVSAGTDSSRRARSFASCGRVSR